MTFRVRIYSQCRIEEQSSKQGRKVTKERTGVKRRLWLSGYARIHGSSQFNAHKLMEAWHISDPQPDVPTRVLS